MSSKNFETCLARLLAHEGGYSNHAADPGGPTNFGITLADYRRYVKPDATAADVRAMQVAQARAIYRAHYWDALRCDELPDGVDYALFDYGVNSGVARAARVLRLLLGLPAADTLSDPVVAAAARCDAQRLVASICDERLAFLKALKTWPVFGAGWTRRVAEVRAEAMAMAAHGAATSPRTAPEADRQQTSPASSAGKGAAPPTDTSAHVGLGAVVAAGLAAAHRLFANGFVAIAVVVAAAAATVALAVALWLRRRRQQQQLAPMPPGETS